MDGRLTISQLHLSGISQSKYEGRLGSVAEAVGIDFHSVKGTFQAAQALASETTGSEPTERCDKLLSCTDGNIYAFSQSSGKVWKMVSNGTWSLAYTTVPTTGSAGCLGAIEFEGYIYWATQNYLHRILVTGTSDWGTNAVANWQLLPVTNSEYHPMAIVNNRLLVGDGNEVHQIYLASFTANALDIMEQHTVVSLGNFDVYLVIGTTSSSGSSSTFYRWNGWSSTWNIESNINESIISAIIPVGNQLFVNAGVTGNFYQYDGSFLSSAFNVPTTPTASSEALVMPNAVTNYKGKTLFGVSNKSGSSVTAGIYGYHTANTSIYPRVLSLEYVVSMNDLGSGVLITALLARGNDLFVAYTNGSGSGVMRVSSTVKQDEAYIATRTAYVDRNKEVSGWVVTVNYVSLPEGTSVEIYSKLDYADTWTQQTTEIDTIRKNVVADIREVANVYEWKVVLRTTGNYSPIIDEINIDVG